MGGFFGVVADEPCIQDLFYGTDYHSHLGTRRGGMAVYHPDGFRRKIHKIENTQFRSKFEEELSIFRGNMGIGVISDYEDQPLLIASHLGNYALATVGVINNLDSLAHKALTNHRGHFTEMNLNAINPTELIASIINQGDTWVEGIAKVQDSVQGSCSLLLVTEEGIYAARDKLGRTPVVLGEKAGKFAIASESSALPNLGYTPVKYLGPGEIVRVSLQGYETVKQPGKEMQICSFLWIYYGYPAASYEDINVEQVRYQCGAALARKDDVDIDLVSGIPDSGIAHALGYAAEAKVPYRRPFVKYTPTWPRSFMPQNQGDRDLIASMKLIPIRKLIQGQRMLLCEDSIVRGTQLKHFIQRLYEYGAQEVHMRVACPPLLYGCKFLNFSRSRSEMDLAARKAVSELSGDQKVDLNKYSDPDSPEYKEMVERIRQRLGLSTLKYLNLNDMQEAIGLPSSHLCTFCWSGKEHA
ncbi:amidophosphoribosyltransferase [candidate division KSB1 bacterium]|nr:amidophosphoribosyltransferase [candidate division KSB1 bacterium]